MMIQLNLKNQLRYEVGFLYVFIHASISGKYIHNSSGRGQSRLVMSSRSSIVVHVVKHHRSIYMIQTICVGVARLALYPENNFQY